MGSPTGGYGNRLNSVLSSLLVAILLDTQINVKWRHIDKFIQSPIKRLFEFDVSEDEGLGLAEKILFPSVKFYLKAAQPYHPRKNIREIARTRLPNIGDYKRYLMEYADPYYMEICANSVYYDKLLRYGLASEQTLRMAWKASEHLRVLFLTDVELLSHYYRKTRVATWEFLDLKIFRNSSY